MDRLEIEYRIKVGVESILLIKPEHIINSADLFKDLGAESLDLLEITMFLEEEFNIEIADIEINTFTTVQSLIDYIYDKNLV